MSALCLLSDGSYSQDSLLIVSPGTSIATSKQDSLYIVSPDSDKQSPETNSDKQDSLLIVSPEIETSIVQNSLLIVSPQTSTNTQDSLLFVSPVLDSSQELFVSSCSTIHYADSELLLGFDPQVEAPLHSTPAKKRRKVSLQLEDSIDFENESPVSSHQFQCCGRVCIAAFTQQEVEKVRDVFNKKKRADQKQFLFDTSLLFLPSSSKQVSSSSKLAMMLEGKRVCKNAFLNILGISKKRFKTVTELFSDGIHKATRKPHVRAEAAKTSEAKTWMRQYFDLIGDKMPHIDRIHLPHFLTKYDVYLRMKRELMAGGIPESAVVKVSTFYRFWKEDFSKVLIPSVSIYHNHTTIIIYRFTAKRFQQV